MAGNYTLTIIKPDAFGAGKAGKIIALLEEKGFKVMAARVMHLTKAQAGEFYAVHRERPFYGALVQFMTSGPCMPMVLEKADAVPRCATRSARPIRRRPAAGTVRKLYAESKGRNAIHASDSRRERGARGALLLRRDASSSGADARRWHGARPSSVPHAAL